VYPEGLSIQNIMIIWNAIKPNTSVLGLILLAVLY
jgi:hypothetical protein